MGIINRSSCKEASFCSHIAGRCCSATHPNAAAPSPRTLLRHSMASAALNTMRPTPAPEGVHREQGAAQGQVWD